MAKNYVRPVLRMEEFVSNEFVSNCYYMNCSTIAGWFDDKNDNGQYDNGENIQNGSDKSNQLVHSDSMPQMRTDDLYTGKNQPTRLLPWIVWAAGFVIELLRGNRGYHVTSNFTPINPGLYIVNDGGTTYGSTQQPTPVSGHPNRS